jgi:hypothetical protein
LFLFTIDDEMQCCFLARAINFSAWGFSWVVPDVAGTYVAEVGLVPAQLTAYDAAWIKVV